MHDIQEILKTSAKRLKDLRESLGMQSNQFAEMFGIDTSSYSRYESESPRKLPIEKLFAIADKFNLTIDWLIGYNKAIKYRELQQDGGHKLVPLLGTVAAGLPIFADGNIEDYECVSEKDDVDFCLRVKGDSMINANILDGDIVYIKKQPDVENKEIAVVIIDDDEATLKRISKADGIIILKAENNEYEDMVFQKKDINRLRIIGKAVYVKSEVR